MVDHDICTAVMFASVFISGHRGDDARPSFCDYVTSSDAHDVLGVGLYYVRHVYHSMEDANSRQTRLPSTPRR